MKLLLDNEILTSLLITIAAGLWLYWLWTRRSWYRFSFKFPCYFGVPLLGAVNRIIHPEDILRLFTEGFAECKQKTFCGWFGMYIVMVTSDPDIIEKVLSSPELLEKAANIYKPLYEAFQGGIISSPVKEWSNHRKLINPSFNHKVILSLFPIFLKAKEQLLYKFNALVGTDEHKLLEMLTQTALNITIETTMGKVAQANDKSDENVVKVLLYLCDAMIKQMWLKFIKLQWLYFFNMRFHKAINFAYNYVNELIICKLKQLHEDEKNRNQPKMETTFESDDDSVLAIKKTPKIFIDQAIQMYQKQQFTLNDIIAESNTIIAASFETIGTVLSSTFIMLAMHPDVQEKLFEEIVCVFPEKDFQIEHEHMEQLPYLDMVLNEIMRLVPPVPIIARQPMKDTKLTKDILLPSDLHIMISIFHLHRNKDIWGLDADKFNPDNFLPDNLAGKHSHAFIPFSKGARNCIGWRYAMYVMKVLIAGSVRNFRYSTTFRYEDLVYVESVTIKYLVEPGIKIHRR